MTHHQNGNNRSTTHNRSCLNLNSLHLLLTRLRQLALTETCRLHDAAIASRMLCHGKEQQLLYNSHGKSTCLLRPDVKYIHWTFQLKSSHREVAGDIDSRSG